MPAYRSSPVLDSYEKPMKKSVLFLLSVLLVFFAADVSAGQSKTGMMQKDDAGQSADTAQFAGEYTDSKDVPFSGIKKEYHLGGELAAEYIYRNGKRNGIARKYFVSGDLEKELPYTNDKLNGVVREYFQDGRIFTEEPYVDGKKEGIAREYFPGFGRIKYETTYKNGKKEGVSREYKASGQLYRKVIFQSDTAVSGYFYTADGSKRKMTNAHLYNLFELEPSEEKDALKR